MAASKIIIIDLPPPFEWGGSVGVKAQYRSRYDIQMGSVCGARLADEANNGDQNVILTIEGDSGVTFDVPIEHLEILEEN